MPFKLSKEQWSNVLWILAIVLIVFTPIGFHLKVVLNKLIATSVDVVKEENQMTLENYDWNLVDLEGNRFNFSQNKEQVVLLNFWATWCPPCIAEMPSMVALYTDYKDKIVFIFVANDEKDKVLSYLEKKGYELPVYFETTQIPRKFQYNSIPVTYILSKSGKIVVHEKGAVNWNSKTTRKLLDGLLLE
ncbi:MULTISPECIES: TlpA family protein disulfide reductase [Flavobacteriaceae]|uniref:TlpA family protein disulfide reductase n=1 Tax=Flavobacteriaceae TaxID=49546 RepID=UPI001492EDC5|nr:MULTISPECIES: TlpA disulfide reductase family protein [Allomuricauda]MDC6367708.1 TlpA disulfide reductase family protein [Muricauda sp. AC10]